MPVQKATRLERTINPAAAKALGIRLPLVPFESFREYRQTGRWPRNEEFIARMKARREVKREAKRRQADPSTNSSAGYSR